MAFRRRTSQILSDMTLGSISLLLTIILTGCASYPIHPITTEYGNVRLEAKTVFSDIKQKITASKKGKVAIIDFPVAIAPVAGKDENGEMIKAGENIAKNMAVHLEQKMGREGIRIESGQSLMNDLQENRIIENGKIANKELAKSFWQNRGIEVVITGDLKMRLNGVDFSIELYDVQDDKVIHQFKGNLRQTDKALRGRLL